MRTMLLLCMSLFAAGCYNLAEIEATFPKDQYGSFGVKGKSTDPIGAVRAVSDARVREIQVKECWRAVKQGVVHPATCSSFQSGQSDYWLHFASQGILPYAPMSSMPQGAPQTVNETVEEYEDGTERVVATQPVAAPAPAYPAAAPVTAAPAGGYASQKDLKRVERTANQARREAAKAKDGVGAMAGHLRSNSGNK